jgi:SPP1 family predicted phage head-tail adaptor
MSLTARGNTDPGQLDRSVVLQAVTTTRDAAGGAVATWATFAEVWAAKNPSGGARFFAAQQKHAEASVVYRIRHRADVLPLMRLVDGAATYEITGTDELGRAHYLDLACRAVDQNTAAKLTKPADV